MFRGMRAFMVVPPNTGRSRLSKSLYGFKSHALRPLSLSLSLLFFSSFSFNAPGPLDGMRRCYTIEVPRARTLCRYFRGRAYTLRALMPSAVAAAAASALVLYPLRFAYIFSFATCSCIFVTRVLACIVARMFFFGAEGSFYSIISMVLVCLLFNSSGCDVARPSHSLDGQTTEYPV